MAYKNSANVKFNDATDLIIRADPDGTVESCYNLSNSTEYVGVNNNITLSKVRIKNNTENYRLFEAPWASDDENYGIAAETNIEIAADQEIEINVICYYQMAFAFVFDENMTTVDDLTVSGNITSDESGNILISGDGNIIINA